MRRAAANLVLGQGRVLKIMGLSNFGGSFLNMGLEADAWSRMKQLNYLQQ